MRECRLRNSNIANTPSFITQLSSIILHCRHYVAGWLASGLLFNARVRDTDICNWNVQMIALHTVFANEWVLRSHTAPISNPSLADWLTNASSPLFHSIDPVQYQHLYRLKSLHSLRTESSLALCQISNRRNAKNQWNQFSQSIVNYNLHALTNWMKKYTKYTKNWVKPTITAANNEEEWKIQSNLT